MGKKLGTYLVALVAALILSSCAGAAEPVAVKTPVPPPVAEPVAPVAATENQVASVLAEYETDWREVIDNAGSCRFGWVLDPDDLEYMSCYLREQTTVTTAFLVLRDWEDLVIPESMQDLVAETSGVLTIISEVDLTGACGKEFVPSDSDACTEALGELNFLYRLLESKLDAWGPYL